ncbi:MAG TPA: TonB-dependent receptor [Kofleriaceae bacterium]|nr:TonB-dependent receptor [Kofleriaceae bacterium]
MKRHRTWYGAGACAGLAALLAAASGTAQAQTAPPQPAPAPAPAPAPTAQPAPAPTQPAPAQPAPAPAQPAPAPTAQPQPTTPADTGAPTPEEVADAEAAAAQAEADGEVIVVTGSRIRTDPLDKQAPVLQLSREELERTGLTSVGDILQQLPSSGGAINGKFNSSGNFGFPPDGGGIGAGAIEADLRYLGSKRVLVLVDGVRWVNGSSASGVSAATDLNTIPLSIIERVEVLEDGASPIYGSDAISGVINIITRKEFEGASATAYTGVYNEGDGFTQKYDLSWGNTTEKMSVVMGASFLDQHDIKSADREISNSPLPGLDNCEAGCSSATPQGRISFADPVTGDPVDVTLNNGVGGLPDPNTDYHVFENPDRFNFSPYNLMLTPSRRLGAFSSVTYKVLPRFQFHGKAAFTHRESVNQAAPEPLFVGPEGGNGNRVDRIPIDVSNPYNPFGFTFDPMNDPTYVVTRRPVEAGPRKFEQTVNTFYMSGGLNGDFNAGKQRFFWDTTVAYGVNRADQLRNNSFNSAKLEQALGPAYQDDENVWRCGTAASPGDPECVPFNIFGGQGANGDGTITQEMLDYVTFVEHDVSEQTLVDVVANIAGEIVKLPAGALSIAAGLEHRRLSGFYEPDAVVAAGDGADVPSKPTSGDYWVNEAYAELRVPVLAGLPGAELVDLSAAGRVSDYSILEPEVTGKLGARWKPMKDLMLRGSYARGFRAPGIGELFGSESRYDAMLNDPCSNFNEQGVSQAIRDRCIALGVPGDGSYEQLNPQISVATGGNIELEPETSDSVTISLAYSPEWLQGQSWVDRLDLELAYYDIHVDGAIAPLDAQLQLDRCVGGDETLCEGITRTSQGSINGFANKLQNLGGFETRGVDINLTYAMPASAAGRFRVTSLSNLLIDFWEKIPTSGGFDTIEREGRVGGEPERAFPRFKSSLVLDWFYQTIGATFTTRYIHKVVEQCPDLLAFPGTCSDPNPRNDAFSKNELPAQVYNDVQLTWIPPGFENNLNITAGVINVFANDPPPCYTCVLNGFNPTTYDVPGIFGYLSATYRMY